MQPPNVVNGSKAPASKHMKERIVRAATALSAEKGFTKITISDIATRVGMTRSLFYHYYPDKDTLATDILDLMIEEIVTHLDRWNEEREVGNVDKALDDFVSLLRNIFTKNSPITPALKGKANAELFISFIDRAARRVAAYMTETTVRDYQNRYGTPIEHVEETFYMMLVGLTTLVINHPTTGDDTLKQIVAQTLHIDSSLYQNTSRKE